MARPDLIGLAVLGLLIEQPRHPYEMQRLMVERHKEFAIGKGRSFYDAVERLQRTGLIEPMETVREGRRPERTVYRITESGVEQFDVRLRELLAAPADDQPTFAAAVGIVGYLTPREALAAFRDREVALRGAIAGLEEQSRALRDDLALPRLLTLELEVTLAWRQGELRWLQSLIDDLTAGRLTWDTGWRQRQDPAEDPPGPDVHVVKERKLS